MYHRFGNYFFSPPRSYLKLILAAHHPEQKKKRQLANPRQIESHMKSRWCPQLSRPIPTLDAILAFGLLSILSGSGTVSCITERWSAQLYNYSSCTIVHNKHYRNNSRVPLRHRKTAAGSVGWSSWSIRKNLHCWQCPGHPQWLVHGPVSSWFCTVLGRPLSQFA